MSRNRFEPPKVVPRDPNKPMGFQNVDKEVVATRGVKLKNKAAEQAAQDKRDREEYMRKFDQRADQTVKYHVETGNNTVDVISNYMRMSEDRTLPHNRGSIGDDVEREIRQKIIQLALDLNNDENEEDNGKGSVIVLSAVTKVLLLYRDRINFLEYELEQLKFELKKKNASSVAQPAGF